MAKTSQNTKFKILIGKIIKSEKIKNSVETILTETHSYSNKKMLQISKLYNSVTTSSVRTNRTFISNKLAKYIVNAGFNTSTIKIADIGGGNGEILKEIGENLSLSKEQLFCVENVSSWSESYDFSNNDNIQYIFWDNVTIPKIKKGSLDVILIMVSLHHMSDNTINNLFVNLNELSRVNSILIIKEHDCKTNDDLYIINWEHHLYHIANNKTLKPDDVVKYKESYMDNFKTKSYYDKLMHGYGYVDVAEFNRLFERSSVPDTKNPTNLYWKIYKKII